MSPEPVSKVLRFGDGDEAGLIAEEAAGPSQRLKLLKKKAERSAKRETKKHEKREKKGVRRRMAPNWQTWSEARLDPLTGALMDVRASRKDAGAYMSASTHEEYLGQVREVYPHARLNSEVQLEELEGCPALAPPQYPLRELFDPASDKHVHMRIAETTEFKWREAVMLARSASAHSARKLAEENVDVLEEATSLAELSSLLDKAREEKAEQDARIALLEQQLAESKEQTRLLQKKAARREEIEKGRRIARERIQRGERGDGRPIRSTAGKRNGRV